MAGRPFNQAKGLKPLNLFIKSLHYYFSITQVNQELGCG